MAASITRCGSRLLALIIGERLMGISGLILAPIIISFVKVEMKKIEMPDDAFPMQRRPDPRPRREVAPGLTESAILRQGQTLSSRGGAAALRSPPQLQALGGFSAAGNSGCAAPMHRSAAGGVAVGR